MIRRREGRREGREEKEGREEGRREGRSGMNGTNEYPVSMLNA
jgi:hypothetical protein